MRTWPQRLTAALFFAAATAIYLFPVLFGGRVLSPGTMLFDVPPWASTRPPLGFGEINSLLSDHPTSFQPWLGYARELIRGGHLPMWNPYALTGTAFLGNAQAAIFSPFSLPTWVLPLEYSFGWQAALRVWVAAFGSYLLARELKLSFVPALIAGVGYGAAPFLILWLSHPHANVLPLVPWVLWLLERTISGGRPRDALLLALPVAVAMLGGHPGSQIHLLLEASIYGLVRLAVIDVPWRERLRRAGLALAGGIAGVALAAVALLPAAALVPGSSGAEGRSGGGPVIPGAAWLTIFFPDWWGRPSALNLGGPFNFNERTLYAGGAALVLAAIGISDIRSWRRWAPLAALVVLGITVPLGVFPFRNVLVALPVLDTVQNGRLVSALALAIPLLAGFGAERLLAGGRPSARVVAIAVAGVAIGVVALIVAGPSVADVRTTINHFRTGTDFPGRDAVVRATAIGWWLLLSGCVLIAVLALRRGAPRGVVAVVLLAVVMLDVGHFARGYQPMPPGADVYPDPPPQAVRTIDRLAGADRVSGLSFVLPPDTGMPYDLHDIRGHDPPEPDERYLALFRVANPTQPPAQFLVVPTPLNPRSKRVLDLLGVRYVMDVPGAGAAAVPGVRKVYAGTDATIYRNAGAVPRAYVPGRVVAASGAADALRTLSSPSFAPGREAVAEGAGTPPAGAGSVAIASDSGDRVVMRTDLSRAGLVVLNDRYQDGWSVKVDGKDAKPVRVNSVARGVVAGAGAHTVTWSYRPPGLVLGAIISLLAAVGLVAAALVLRRRSR